MALVLLACLALCGVGSAPAVADDSGALVQATVYGPGGAPTQTSVSPAYLLAHANQCPLYSGGTLIEYSRTGQEPITPNPSRSWTLGTILGCLQTPVTPGDVTGVTVFGSDGAPQTGPNSQLRAADLATPSDFLDTAQNPVVQSVGVNQYDRPQRNPSDLDFLDEFQENAPIAVEVFEGPPLTVTAMPPPTTVTVGSTVNFSAVVSGNDGSELSYSWTFGGGAAASTQATPRITFDTAGVWTVSLQVTDANGGGGGDQTTVTVNQPGASSAPTTTGPTTTGPNKSAGTTPNAPPTRKKKKTTGTQPTGTRHTHGKGQGSPSTTHASTTQTSTTQTTTTQTTSAPAGGSGGGSSGSPGAESGATSPAPAPVATPHRAPTAPAHRAAPPAAPAQNTLVRGELISDVVPLPADRSPLVHLVSTPAGGAPARQARERSSAVVPIIAAVLAILVLLGLGAQRELGWPRHLRDARWWRTLRVGG